jgi:hypothetical protein
MARHFKSAATAPRHFKAGVLDHLTPAAGDVLTGHAAWDPHGASGTYHAPEASEVAFGAVVGTTTGTYQLTATTQAADAAILEAQKDHAHQRRGRRRQRAKRSCAIQRRQQRVARWVR